MLIILTLEIAFVKSLFRIFVKNLTNLTMSEIKSFSVGERDMFYIRHNTDNFTTIDCCLSDDNKDKIIQEIREKSNGKEITRFISTHPDEDHIQNLDYYDDKLGIVNFYVVQNEAIKEDETSGFIKYCELRDSKKKAFYIFKGCSRKWMNMSDEERGSSGINILWPITSNKDFQEELQKAKNGESYNNLSPIITYSLQNGATIIWMGDMESDFMEKIKDEINLPKANVLFAPHHGRKSGKVIREWLDQMNPDIVVIGECPAEHLCYYPGYNRITQNKAGDILFDCNNGEIDVYVSNQNYSVDFLENKHRWGKDGLYYLGTLIL